MSGDPEFYSFEDKWRKAGEDDRAGMFSRLTEFPAGQAVSPALDGLASYHFSVRTKAKAMLDTLKSEVLRLNTSWSHREDFFRAVEQSSLFSARMYQRLTFDQPVQEMKYHLELLLESGGRGPFYAWRFCQDKKLSEEMLKNILCALSETAKLALVDQYLVSTPLVRRKFGPLFRQMLGSLQERAQVITFYASLFDRQRDADPFLDNIPLSLRNPRTITENELVAGDVGRQIKALKALSRMVSRIDPKMLSLLFTRSRSASLRKTVLTIVENSYPGTYPELAEPVMATLADGNQNEALAAFRALAVCRTMPLPRLVDRVKKRAGWLMPAICKELSSFSRISLLFINDVLNSKRVYLETNREVYKALVLGMVKKRPERIIDLLDDFGDISGDSDRMAAFELSRKIEILFLEEKNAIASWKEGLVEQSSPSPEPKETRGFFNGLFLSPLEKKIKTVWQGRAEAVDFNHETIEHLDFSSQLFLLRLTFNGCRIKDSDFSFSSFVSADFNRCRFKNVNLDGTKFDSISFENALFINVSARGSEFVNCSFYGATLVNSDFTDASMVDALLTGSVVTGCSFTGTDLTGATFAGAEICELSFVKSMLFHTDFTAVRAKFCRFPSHAFPVMASDCADFNARSFPMEIDDLSDALFSGTGGGSAVSWEFDLLLLTEFMRFGKRQFLKKNKMSLLTAFDLFKPPQADLFAMVPLLVHGNISFPGFDAEKAEAPHGISGYHPSRESREIAKSYLKKDLLDVQPVSLVCVEALYTIGSIGSIAQASGSDIDYWVCIRQGSSETLKQNLQHKLDLIEKWSMDRFQTEIHFFIVDVNQAKEDNFGDSSVESSGSAQGKILKEEFYRTMIHVAGKLPLWCTVTASLARNYYEDLNAFVCKNPEQCRFLDIGDIHDIPADEYFGASIWQMFKLLKSPFKSVLKMALLDTFIHESGEESLLCNKVKDQWLTSGFQFDLGKTDSYYVLLNSLVEYYQTSNDGEAVGLVQLCFFLKAGISSRSCLDNTLFGFRKKFVEQCMVRWHWNRNQVYDAGKFSEWEYGRVNRLSETIQKYMVKVYKKVNREMNGKTANRPMITPEDRTALGRKMFVQFSKHPDKIEKHLLVSGNAHYFQRLSLRHTGNTSGQDECWELIHKQTLGTGAREALLISGSTIEKIAAWIFHNGFYSETTVFYLVPNPVPVSVDDISDLLREVHSFFSRQDQGTRFEDLSSKEEIRALFVSLNLCTPRSAKKIHQCTALYLNSWGEMFCIFFSEPHGFDSMDQLVVRLKKELKVEQLPEQAVFFMPKSFKAGSRVRETTVFSL